MQVTFKPAANARGANTRAAQRRRSAQPSTRTSSSEAAGERGADATIAMWKSPDGDPFAVLVGRASGSAGRGAHPRAARRRHPDGERDRAESPWKRTRGGTALHFAVRKRYKARSKQLAGFKIDTDAVDQGNLTALDYTQSRGFMPFMALQTPLYEGQTALLRELSATKLMDKSPVWPECSVRRKCGRDIWPAN